MGNTGIDYVKEFVLSFLLVKHDAVGDVNDLHNCLTFERAAFNLNISFLAAILSFFDNCKNGVIDFIIISKKVTKTIIDIGANTAIIRCLIHIDQLVFKLKLFENWEIKKLILLLQTIAIELLVIF